MKPLEFNDLRGDWEMRVPPRRSGQDPYSRAADQLCLPADGGQRLGKGAPVGADAENGDPRGTQPANLRGELPSTPA